MKNLPREKQSVNNLTIEGKTSHILPSGSLLSSQKAKWDGLHFGFYYQSPDGVREFSCTQHVVVVHTEVPPLARSERKLVGRFQNEQLRTGDIVVVPANIRHWTHSDKV